MNNNGFNNRFYGANAVPYEGYSGYKSTQVYGNGIQHPYNQYYNHLAQPYQPGYQYGMSQVQKRPATGTGYQRKPNQNVAPPNNRHSSKIVCEPCGMVFDTKIELSEHVEELHISCEVAGCSYSAPLDLMNIHNLKHIKNEKGELVLESPEETRKWIENRRNRHPSNRHRNKAAVEESALERLLREAHRKQKSDSPTKSVLYPVIAKVRDRPSALLHLTDPAKYHNLVRRTFGPYSYRPSLSIGRGICQSYRRTSDCKFGDLCQYSHDLKGGTSRDASVTKRPPTLLHLLKKDIYETEKTLVSAIKTIVSLDFFDDEE